MNGFFEELALALELPLSNPVQVFSLILIIILLSPILLKKLKIPGIIGLILAGLLIGPHGLGWLENNSAIELFSTIGLLYIMFIVGLELDIDGFKKSKHKSILFGVFTFIIPIGIGWPVCYYLLDYEQNASLLVASMFATHTLLAYPIISKFGISRNEAVVITVGGTILTDTAVLMLLGVIVGAEQGGLSALFWLRMGISITVFSLFMFLFVPKIATWFFSKLESEKTSHYVFVLATVFMSAFLAEIAGLEPIIGAFVAGLALNPLIPRSSTLMNRIEFIGNSLFIPFFLISVGMIVDLSVVFKGTDTLIAAGALTIVALSSKFLAASLTSKLFNFSSAQRNVIFGLSSAHAAATIAVIFVGYKFNIIDEKILNGTIILILITCIVASFVTERGAIRIVKEEETLGGEKIEETDSRKNERILLPIANFNTVDTLMEMAMFLKDKQSKNPITLSSVVHHDGNAEFNLSAIRRKLEDAERIMASNEVPVQSIATIDYNVASGIVRIAKEVHSNIILLGWPRKTSLMDRFFGHKTDNIIDKSDKNIFICHLVHPLSTHRRLLVYLPPYVELERGFNLILRKAFNMADELSLKVLFYCLPKTAKYIEEFIAGNQVKAFVLWELISAPGEFRLINSHIQKTDIFMVVNARKTSVSYSSYLDTIPRKLDQDFSENSVILIYPQVEDVADDLKSIGTTF